MRKKSNEYRRLPGRHKNFIGGLSTLWQGTDHLLSISYIFGTERYKRFYYRDIQAFIVRKTAAGKIQNMALAAAAAFFGLPAVFWGEIAAGIFGSLAAVMLLILLINVWRGPTCECLVQTAVQKERLKNLYRLKTAFKTLETIQPLLQNVQGRLSGEELRAAWAPSPPKSAHAPSGRPAGARPLAIHVMFFSTLLFLGLVTGVMFFRQHILLFLAELVFGLGAAVLLIPALVRQHQSDMTQSVRVITWISAGYMAGWFLCGYVVYMFVAFQHPMAVYDQWQLMELSAELSPQSHPLLYGLQMFTSMGAATLGPLGLLLLKRSESR